MSWLWGGGEGDVLVEEHAGWVKDAEADVAVLVNCGDDGSPWFGLVFAAWGAVGVVVDDSAD